MQVIIRNHNIHDIKKILLLDFTRLYDRCPYKISLEMKKKKSTVEVHSIRIIIESTFWGGGTITCKCDVFTSVLLLALFILTLCI